jgi:signal transduction histidine kinase
MPVQLQVIAVEDSATDSELVARHLAKAGLNCVIHRVETEPDFTSALQTVQPDLILSDFSLPQFDGMRALEIALEDAPETPFIFVSGTIGVERAVDALQRGASDYVEKTDLSRLSSAVERALGGVALKAARRYSERPQEEPEVDASPEQSREDERPQRPVSLEETLRVRIASLEQANQQLHKQMRLRHAAELELETAQKLEALGRLAAGIAHEINTPIQYISDSVYFLGCSFDDLLTVVPSRESSPGVGSPVDLDFLRDEIPRAIGRIKEGTQRVAIIARAMKEFAHPDANEKVPSDLNRAIETTLLIARSEYKYVATVQLQLEDLPPVTCNVGELSQVFLNLLVNAAHALADAGRDAESGRITVRTKPAEEWVELQFEDNGCGIPADIMDKIYNPFFTTKEVGRGSGQGLAIARSVVVDKHSGRISVTSTPGIGTCFTLHLPVGAPRSGRDYPSRTGD